MNDIFKIRRDNLMSLVLERFTGNRAALARASQVHPNHINLVLSTNEAHRRNIGEDLARRMEVKLSLPQKWLDSPHGVENRNASVSVASLPIQASLSHVLRESKLTGISATNDWMEGISPEATALQNLFIASVSTSDMTPRLSVGDLVLVDGGVKVFTVEGTYIIDVSGDVLMRHIKKTISGGYLVISSSSEEKVDKLDGIKVLGRVVQKINFTRV